MQENRTSSKRSLGKWFRNKLLCEKYRNHRSSLTLLSAIFDTVEKSLNWCDWIPRR